MLTQIPIKMLTVSESCHYNAEYFELNCSVLTAP
jgi:hypothetical protein